MPKIREREHIYKAHSICYFLDGERSRLEITQDEMAKRLGLCRQTYARKIREADLSLMEILKCLKELYPGEDAGESLRRIL